MKYIRTDDGVYEDAGTDALGLRCVRYKGHKIVLSQDDDKIVKEAETIEELCDAMVVKYSDESFPRVIDMQELLKSCKHTGIKPREHVSFLFETFSKKLEYIVGAIWVGEGNLKAVAKFNKEGEMELI